MRYKLRSSKQPPRCTEPSQPRGSNECPAGQPEIAGGANLRRRKTLVKTSESAGAAGLTGHKLTVFSLSQDVVLMVVELLDLSRPSPFCVAASGSTPCFPPATASGRCSASRQSLPTIPVWRPSQHRDRWAGLVRSSTTPGSGTERVWGSGGGLGRGGSR